MSSKKPKIDIPGYRIIKKVGEGGMSVVYLAFQESLKREVALKVMRPVITEEESVVKRFEQEAEIIAQLYHPNIVSIYEVGHVDETLLFYSMPYLQHGDLTTFEYHDDTTLKNMLIGICNGLEHAHNQGVIHRDIKPENILFDQFGNVQIADFGIALSTGQQRFTKDRKIVGSVHYMSPEQAESKHIDARSDVYSLGAILYELLTGEPVFDRDSDLSIMMAHLSDPVPALPAEKAHWQGIIDACLAKSPDDRYQDIATLRAAIKAVQQDNSKQQLVKWSMLAVVIAVVAVVAFVQFAGDDQNEKPIETVNNENRGEPIDLMDSGTVAAVIEAEPTASEVDAEVEPNQLPRAQQQVTPVVNTLSVDEEATLLKNVQRNIERKQLTTPENNNALDDLLTLLRNMPQHPEGLKLLSEVMAGYYELLYQAVLKNDLQQAESFADAVAEVRHRTILTNENLLLSLEKNTEMQRSLMIGAVVEKVQVAKSNLNQAKAKRYISLIDRVIPGQELVDELLNNIDSMLRSGQVLTDKLGIKSVVVTPQLGNKKGLLNYGLAVTQSEITWQQYDRFASVTQRDLNRCKSSLKVNLIFSQRNYLKPGFKIFNDMPVVCVSWQDAKAYAVWLSQQTGHTYRLPSAREWRHLMRLAGNKTQCGAANLAGKEFPDKDEVEGLYGCDDGATHVARRSQFGKNALGLYGLNGNVSEWISGCERMGKFKAILKPDDLCDSNSVMGRSWLSTTSDDGGVKKIDFDESWTHIGFRLVRDLRKEQ